MSGSPAQAKGAKQSKKLNLDGEVSIENELRMKARNIRLQQDQPNDPPFSLRTEGKNTFSESLR